MWGVNTMTINLYNVPEGRNHISKTLGTPTTHTGAARGEIDTVSPVVMVAATIRGDYNYAYISDFDMYYWIADITIVREGLTQIAMNRDPLTTFAAGVRACPCIAQRSGDLSKTTAFIPDSRVKSNAYTINQVRAASDIFGYNGKTILLTTG